MKKLILLVMLISGVAKAQTFDFSCVVDEWSIRTPTNQPPLQGTDSYYPFSYYLYRFSPTSDFAYAVVEESRVEGIQQGEIIFMGRRNFAIRGSRTNIDGSRPVAQYTTENVSNGIEFGQGGTSLYFADVTNGRLVPNDKIVTVIRNYNTFTVVDGDALQASGLVESGVEMVNTYTIQREFQRHIYHWVISIPANHAQFRLNLEHLGIDAFGDPIWEFRTRLNAGQAIGYKVPITRTLSYNIQSRTLESGEYRMSMQIYNQTTRRWEDGYAFAIEIDHEITEL